VVNVFFHRTIACGLKADPTLMSLALGYILSLKEYTFDVSQRKSALAQMLRDNWDTKQPETWAYKYIDLASSLI